MRAPSARDAAAQWAGPPEAPTHGNKPIKRCGVHTHRRGGEESYQSTDVCTTEVDGEGALYDVVRSEEGAGIRRVHALGEEGAHKIELAILAGDGDRLPRATGSEYTWLCQLSRVNDERVDGEAVAVDS